MPCSGTRNGGILTRHTGIRSFLFVNFWVLIAFTANPALALDLNSFRAQHGRPALSVSSALAGIAYEQAHSMARHFFSVIPGRSR